MRTLVELLQAHPSVTNEVAIGYEKDGREVIVMTLSNKDEGMTTPVFLHMVLDMRMTIAACHKNGNEIKLFWRSSCGCVMEGWGSHNHKVGCKESVL